MRRFYTDALLFCFALFILLPSFMIAQDITTDDVCFGLDTWTQDGTDATGRNIYDNDTETTFIRWNAANNRWEMNTEDQSFAYWHNSFASSPNPPDFNTGSWTYVACAATGISGPGTQNTLLPISLTNFTGKLSGRHILLEWQTATELNNDYMAIERSIDGRQFQEIGRINGAGTTNEAQDYIFKDQYPLLGINYYRLRQVDFDGQTTYHDVILVDYQLEGIDVQLSPNPTVGQLNIQLAKSYEHQLEITLYNLHGQAILKQHLKAGQNLLELDMSDLNTGHYILEVSNQNNLLLQERIVKF